MTAQTTLSPAQTSTRMVRCRMTDRRRNPCPNPALTEYGVCMRHLHEAADEWARVIGEVTEHYPGAVYDATAAERGLT